MDALIFASYVPKSEQMYVIEEFFNTFLNYFKDVDFYIGINDLPCKEYIDFLENIKYKIKLTYEVTDRDLRVNSDVSAFQTALRLMYQSNKEYENIWFGHTKGITNVNEYTVFQREDFINNFFAKREQITELLKDEKLGSYSLYLVKCKDCEIFPDLLKQYYPFEKTYFYSYLYLYTFYVVKGKYLHKFLNGCDSKFYTTNLIKNGGDVYMFERDFPQVIWRLGGIPAYTNWGGHLVIYGGTPESDYAVDVKNYFYN